PWSGGSRSNPFAFSLSKASMPLKLAATLNRDGAVGSAIAVGGVGATSDVRCAQSLSSLRCWAETSRICARSRPLRAEAGVALVARPPNGVRCAYRWIVRTVVDPDALAALVPSPVTPTVDARMASVQMENSRRRGFNAPPFDETDSGPARRRASDGRPQPTVPSPDLSRGRGSAE